MGNFTEPGIVFLQAPVNFSGTSGPDKIAGCFLSLTLVRERRGKTWEYSGIPISRTSKGNANWFEKSGVREIEGGIKLRLIGRVLFGYE